MSQGLHKLCPAEGSRPPPLQLPTETITVNMSWGCTHQILTKLRNPGSLDPPSMAAADLCFQQLGQFGFHPETAVYLAAADFAVGSS